MSDFDSVANYAFLGIEHLAESYEQQVKVLQAAREHLLNEETLERAVESRTAAIRQREEEIAMRLLAAAGIRDEETGSHVRRIGLFSAAVGQALGWSAGRIADIRVAAPMHDIGKIGMDQNILTKPGVLTPEEFTILKTHTTRGAEMLRPVSEFADLLAGVELHHESMDGSGYPYGLKGDQIPLMARIISVADTFDAMTHDRTYQDAMEGAYALRIIRTMAGKKFDERAVEAFCRAYSAGLVVLPKRREAKSGQKPGQKPEPVVESLPAGPPPTPAVTLVAKSAELPSLISATRD